MAVRLNADRVANTTIYILAGFAGALSLSNLGPGWAIRGFLFFAWSAYIATHSLSLEHSPDGTMKVVITAPWT